MYVVIIQHGAGPWRWHGITQHYWVEVRIAWHASAQVGRSSVALTYPLSLVVVCNAIPIVVHRDYIEFRLDGRSLGLLSACLFVALKYLLVDEGPFIHSQFCPQPFKVSTHLWALSPPIFKLSIQLSAHSRGAFDNAKNFTAAMTYPHGYILPTPDAWHSPCTIDATANVTYVSHWWHIGVYPNCVYWYWVYGCWRWTFDAASCLYKSVRWTTVTETLEIPENELNLLPEIRILSPREVGVSLLPCRRIMFLSTKQCAHK